ncbi:hypothetical protein KM176_23685 [Pseudooceanicola sp. CBS1P-1]|uniref:Uncharacterized protein n=1 Tax=Pseudooceanicola albus TaxID=2692189 RepID=A0A6L7GAL6_9RHOB|nr:MULTISPECIES: hypothetical protein [Pseudooceanicola]MBT9386865.1 hypothetical protein [Pseudooceanicola endophyticus]MXN20999.1 hypothetical protein [Pseudooceanicola albus]
MSLYELRYQAGTSDRPRRVILVVKEREGDLLLDHFFLVTLLPWTEKLRLKVLTPALSSTSQTKSHRHAKKLRQGAKVRPNDECLCMQRSETADLLPRLSGYALRPTRYGAGNRWRHQNICRIGI